MAKPKARPAAADGRTLFDSADALGYSVATSCGRSGLCHECIVEVRAGMAALAPRTEAEGFLPVERRPHHEVFWHGKHYSLNTRYLTA